MKLGLVNFVVILLNALIVILAVTGLLFLIVLLSTLIVRLLAFVLIRYFFSLNIKVGTNNNSNNNVIVNCLV